MELIDKVFRALSDGSWHDLNELSTSEGLRNVSVTKLTRVLNFLAEYDFIELNEAWKGEPLRPIVEAKLQPSFQEFYRKIQQVERTEKGGKVDAGSCSSGQRRERTSFLLRPAKPHNIRWKGLTGRGSF